MGRPADATNQGNAEMRQGSRISRTLSESVAENASQRLGAGGPAGDDARDAGIVATRERDGPLGAVRAEEQDGEALIAAVAILIAVEEEEHGVADRECLAAGETARFDPAGADQG